MENKKESQFSTSQTTKKGQVDFKNILYKVGIVFTVLILLAGVSLYYNLLPQAIVDFALGPIASNSQSHNPKQNSSVVSSSVDIDKVAEKEPKISSPKMTLSSEKGITEEIKHYLDQQIANKLSNSSEADKQRRTLLTIIEKQAKVQQQRMSDLEKKIARFSILINRWKKRLADADLLIDNIDNHLQLIQSQMVLNYSPELLAEQLEEVDKLVDQTGIEALNELRLELQGLVRKLDFKSSVPLDSWLKDIELAENLLPMWMQQHQVEKAENSINITIEESPTLKNQPASTIDKSDGDETIHKGFFDTLWQFIVNKTKNAVSFSKKTPMTPVIDYSPSAPVKTNLSDAQISRYFRSRLEQIRLSILSRDWDILRQQSVEMNIWLGENLPVAQKRLANTLAMMSQYKPEFVDQSLSRAIAIVQNYRRTLRQQEQTQKTHHSPLNGPMTTTKSHLTIEPAPTTPVE